MSDFDELVQMHQEDPEAFEREQRRIIDDFIESLPNESSKQKARQFQFRIDRELRPYKDPTARMNKMVELFWEGVKEFQHALQTCTTDDPNPALRESNPSDKAEIFEFKRKE
jgi:hypothetical protein